MTNFEMFMFGSVALMFAFMFLFGIICLVKRNDVKSIKNINNDNIKNVENNNQRISYMDNNNNIHNDRINRICDNNVGNIHGKINNRQNIQSTRCYENGEITNLCAIIALKTILREYHRSLSNIEKDAINKGVDSIISIEKLNNFINGEESIDIEDYI